MRTQLVVVGQVEAPVTGRRRGRLVRAALRVGFLTVGVGAAWCGYDMATTVPARAAEHPPVVGDQSTQSAARQAASATDLIRAVLTPVVAADRSSTGPSRPVAPVGQAPPVNHAPAEPVAPPAAPPSPAKHGSPLTEVAAPSTEPTPPVPPSPSTEVPGPSSPGRLPTDAAPTAPRRAGSRPAVGEDQVPAAVARLVVPVADTLGPLAEPLIAALSQLLAPTSPLLDTIVADLEPILRELAPVLGPLDPILDLLDPVVALPQPAPDAPEPDPVPQPTPDPTGPPVDGTPPVDVVPPVDPAATDAVTPGRSSAGTASLGSAPSSPRAGAKSAGGTKNRPDRQAERTPGPAPLSSAPGTGGVDPSPTSHGGAADVVLDAWAPPTASGRVTRPDRTRRHSSRSPRPRSRPA
ncbi:hypothetical protein [Micromonospora sp. LOL_024]|uniref:hypothetical protein n=1 Tax=Micromonospora sp. LOL_024 TaxID=3345412 RepID=UPI003A8860AA